MKKAILALTLLLACDGYQLVGLEPVPIFFDVNIAVFHEERLSAAVNAFFSPGRDETGRENVFADSTTMINDEPVLPTRIRDGDRFYEWRTGSVLGSSAPVPDNVSVIGPTLAGGDDWTRAIETRIPRRLEAFRREHPIGDTISLELPPVLAPGDALGPSVRWQLEVARAGFSEISMQGSSASGTRIDIPWQWLPEVDAGDSLEVRYTRFTHFALVNAPYPTHVAQTIFFRWRLIVVAP